MIIILVFLTLHGVCGQTPLAPDAARAGGTWEQPGALTVTIQGECMFTPAPRVRLVEKATGRPLKGVPVILGREGHLTEVTSGAMGEVPITRDGEWTLLFEGDQYHLPCRSKRVVVLQSKTSGRGNWWVKWAFLLASGLYFLFLFRHRLRALMPWFRKRVEVEDAFTDEGFVRISSGRFRLSTLFSSRHWRGEVVDWKGGRPLSGAVLQIGGKEHPVDRSGRFEVAPSEVPVLVTCAGYKSQHLRLGKDGGAIVVKMISLRHWALFLLRKIFEKHDKENAPAMTPREGLAREIPPPHVIVRLEVLAYGDEMPAEGELDALREQLEVKPSP